MSSRTAINSLIHRIQQGLSEIEFIHLPHPRWPLPHSTHHNYKHPVRISVLDSSFNCPTKAHLALARARLPESFTAAENPGSSQETQDYSGRLLLLSVRNVDKQIKPGDATYLQRIEMMMLLTRDISSTPRSTDAISQQATGNAAIAIIDEPTFVGKSSKLISCLHRRLIDIQSCDSRTSYPPTQLSTADDSESLSLQPQLIFILGMDTMERLIAPRYYTPDEGSGATEEDTMRAALSRFLSADYSTGDNSRIVCASRIMSEGQNDAQPDLSVVHEFLFSVPPRIVMMDIGEKERTLSSSAVRDMVRKGNEEWKTMVTNSIAEYVEREGLYTEHSRASNGAD